MESGRMMRLPSIVARDVIKKLKKAGFIFDRQAKGSPFAPTTPPPDCKSGASTGWRSEGGMSLYRNGVDECVFYINDEKLGYHFHFLLFYN